MLINCAVSTAQSYFFKSLDFDTAANIIKSAHFKKETKIITLANSSLLWDTVDAFNGNVLRTHFSKIDSQINLKFNLFFYSRYSLSQSCLVNVIECLMNTPNASK